MSNNMTFDPTDRDFTVERVRGATRTVRREPGRTIVNGYETFVWTAALTSSPYHQGFPGPGCGEEFPKKIGDGRSAPSAAVTLSTRCTAGSPAATR